MPILFLYTQNLPEHMKQNWSSEIFMIWEKFPTKIYVPQKYVNSPMLDILEVKLDGKEIKSLIDKNLNTIYDSNSKCFIFMPRC